LRLRLGLYQSGCSKLKPLFCWRGHCDPTLFSLRWPLGRGTPLRSRQRSCEPQAHIISIRVPSSLRYPHFTGSAPTRGFQIAPSLRLLKSLFCWRGHCDRDRAICASIPGVEILVLLEGALRRLRAHLRHCLERLKSLFCWRGHCDLSHASFWLDIPSG